MTHLPNWLFGTAALLALMTLVFSVFDLIRRLLARSALRLCQKSIATEGGFICDLKQRLSRFAQKPLIPQVILMLGSIAVLVFIYIEYSAKL